MALTTGAHDNELRCLLSLSLIEKVGPKTCRSLIQRFGSAKGVFEAKLPQLRKFSHLTENALVQISTGECFRAADVELEKAAKYGTRIVSWADPAFPSRLLEIDDSPLVLFVKGSLPKKDQPLVAIVGTRTPSNYGRRMAAEFANYLAERGVGIVSGMAFGIDYEAHRATILTGGATFGVLGHGLGQIYPREHTGLAQQVVERGGGLLTEFGMETAPDSFNFPARNRIISGLCEAVVVVEAAEKGGALITARMAFEQNRDVYAIPGCLGSETSIGCNLLIKNQIARIACGPKDVVEGMEHLLKVVTMDQAGKDPYVGMDLDPADRRVLTALGAGETTISTLAESMKLYEGELWAQLLQMELKGLVRILAGNAVEANHGSRRGRPR